MADALSSERVPCPYRGVWGRGDVSGQGRWVWSGGVRAPEGDATAVPALWRRDVPEAPWGETPQQGQMSPLCRGCPSAGSPCGV